MSHIDDFLDNTPGATHRKGDITSAWDCYNAASKSAKIYRSQVKTPKRRISYYAADLPAETEERQYSEVLDDLVATSWNVYKCSPMWNVKWKQSSQAVREAQEGDGDVTINVMRMLDNHMEREYEEKGLKSCARIIQGYVATHSVSGQDQDNPYKVQLETLKGLRGTSTDSDAIKITVYTSMFDEHKIIFIGVLCGIESAELQIKSVDCVNLPVFLTKGNVDTRERVIFGLEKCFDCIISPLSLPDEELKWMSAMWAGLQIHEVEEDVDDEDDEEENDFNVSNRNAEKSKGKTKVKKKTVPKKKKNVSNKPEELKMSYIVPRKDESSKPKIRHITCAFPMTEIRKIWHDIHTGSDVEFADNEMESFHKILRSTIEGETEIDLDKLELIQISLPFLKIGSSGILRIEKSDHVKVVLRYLTELCQGNMFQPDPTLSAASVQDNCTMEWE